MKAVQTYLTLIVLLISSTIFSQENTPIKNEKELSNDLISVSENYNPKKKKKTVRHMDTIIADTKQNTSVTSVYQDQNPETRSLTKATLEISEVSVPRTTIDFF